MDDYEVKLPCQHDALSWGNTCLKCLAGKDAESARLTAELAASQERERVLREAIEHVLYRDDEYLPDADKRVLCAALGEP